MCGVKTNIVTAGESQGHHANDSKMLPALATATAHNFQTSEVSADKGYASKDNAEAITALGATPFISFASHHRGNGTGAWRKMYHYFQFKREDLLAHYHKRSNVESTFSMMKRKFGELEEICDRVNAVCPKCEELRIAEVEKTLDRLPLDER